MTDESRFAEAMTEFLIKYGKVPSVVITGGSVGADQLAMNWAQQRGIPLATFLPDYEKYGKGAPVVRNADIVHDATHLLAFPSKSGRGTQDTIRKAAWRIPPENTMIVWI